MASFSLGGLLAQVGFGGAVVQFLIATFSTLIGGILVLWIWERGRKDPDDDQPDL